jgi:hypothetical protein
MDIDDKITRVKSLIEKREEIDAELADMFGINIRTKKTLRCSKCGIEGHNAKTCLSQRMDTE